MTRFASIRESVECRDSSVEYGDGQNHPFFLRKRDGRASRVSTALFSGLCPQMDFGGDALGVIYFLNRAARASLAGSLPVLPNRIRPSPAGPVLRPEFGSGTCLGRFEAQLASVIVAQLAL